MAQILRRRLPPEVDCFVMHVAMRPEVRSRQRRAFRRRLNEQARQLGVLIVQRQGMSLLFGAERVCTTVQRALMLKWLDDRPEPSCAAAFEMQCLRDLLRSGEPPDAAFKAVRGTAGEERLRSIVHRLAGKMIEQWIRYVEGRIP